MPVDNEAQVKFQKTAEIMAAEASKVLTMLLNNTVDVSYSDLVGTRMPASGIVIKDNSLLITTSFEQTNLGPASLVVTDSQAAIIADLMMGGNGGDQALDDTKQMAFSEAMNQVFNAVANRLVSFGPATSFKIKTPEVRTLSPVKANTLIVPEGTQEPVGVSFKIKIGRVVDDVIQIELNADTVNIIVNELFDLTKNVEVEKLAPIENNSAEESAAEAPTATTNASFGVSGVNFAAQSDRSDPSQVDEDKNLNLLMDIKMGLIVELGRSEMALKDILKLAKGSVIELDRLSGEPVDLFVNNKLIARGEVVVIDDNFGLRITQLAGNLNLAREMGALTATEV